MANQMMAPLTKVEWYNQCTCRTLLSSRFPHSGSLVPPTQPTAYSAGPGRVRVLHARQGVPVQVREEPQGVRAGLLWRPPHAPTRRAALLCDRRAGCKHLLPHSPSRRRPRRSRNSPPSVQRTAIKEVATLLRPCFQPPLPQPRFTIAVAPLLLCTAVARTPFAWPSTACFACCQRVYSLHCCQ